MDRTWLDERNSLFRLSMRRPPCEGKCKGTLPCCLATTKVVLFCHPRGTVSHRARPDLLKLRCTRCCCWQAGGSRFSFPIPNRSTPTRLARFRNSIFVVGGDGAHSTHRIVAVAGTTRSATRGKLLLPDGALSWHRCCIARSGSCPACSFRTRRVVFPSGMGAPPRSGGTKGAR